MMKKGKAVIAAFIVVVLVSVTSCQEEFVFSNTPADTAVTNDPTGD